MNWFVLGWAVADQRHAPFCLSNGPKCCRIPPFQSTVCPSSVGGSSPTACADIADESSCASKDASGRPHEAAGDGGSFVTWRLWRGKPFSTMLGSPSLVGIDPPTEYTVIGPLFTTLDVPSFVFLGSFAAAGERINVN